MEVAEAPVVAPPKNDLTLGLQEVADILGMKLSTAQQYASTFPDRLPPRLNLPGRRVRFLRAEVERWLIRRSSI